MSIAIDIGFVATKFCTLVVGEKLRKKIATLSNVTIVGTLAGSAGMNVYAFAAPQAGSRRLSGSGSRYRP
jgi:hypothetical protein